MLHLVSYSVLKRVLTTSYLPWFQDSENLNTSFDVNFSSSLNDFIHLPCFGLVLANIELFQIVPLTSPLIPSMAGEMGYGSQIIVLALPPEIFGICVFAVNSFVYMLDWASKCIWWVQLKNVGLVRAL